MKLRAPTEHGQILAVPALDQVAPLLQRNRAQLTSNALPWVGKSLAELRCLARREVLTASTQYHHEAGESIPGSSSDVWLLGGHQPELFHPGVWIKNFALHQLARKHGALSLNLVVDTDTAKPALLHVPTGLHTTRIPFDRSDRESPYEERGVQDEAMFAELPARFAEISAGWDFEPMLPAYWREVLRQRQRTPLLGERLAAARRATERRWGCVQHEVPMSRVSQTEAFAWFACSILGRLPTFHDAYNQTVREHRRTHGIRSRNHPVPDLGVDGEWLEAPFWAWRRGQARRGKLFLRHTAEAWTLRVNGEEWPTLPALVPADTVEAWRALEAQGFKVRARALTTTMFARLFLADLFIHGIGGGLNDELTDRIIERYFEMTPPAFLILSATLLLPLPRFPQAAAQLRQRSRELRDLIWKPELFLAAEHSPQLQRLIDAKKDWIAHAGATHDARAERFRRIRAISKQLQPHVQSRIESVQKDLQEHRRQIEWHQTAARRDYAFCLYPEEMLRRFYQTEF